MTRTQQRSVRTSAVLAGVLATLAMARGAVAEPAEGDDAPLASAASSSVTRAELDERAHARTLDLLRQLPGLFALQVDGGGQAEAYLVRGFDARSGLELEVLVDGVPVNQAGLGSEHGYADTQLVNPDTVERVALSLGPYAARHGDFASAGALELTTLDEVPGGGAVLRMSSGMDLQRPLFDRLKRLFYRVSGMASPALETSHALIAVEVGIGDGSFVHPLRLRRGAVLAKWTAPLAHGSVQLTANLSSGRASNSGLVPEAEVDAERVDRFGSIDASLSDTAMRASVSARVTTTDTAGATWHIGAYAVAANHRFYSNDTGYLRDTDSGDQLEAADDRTQLGLDGWYQRAHAAGPIRGQLRLGVQGRADDGDGELWHTDHRARVASCFGMANPCLQASAHTRDVAVYGEDQERLGIVRVLAGVRLDQLTWDVADAAPGTPAPASGNAARARLSPKLGVIVEPLPGLALSALGGGGFRTSDSRAVVMTDAVRAVPRLWSAELGARYQPGAWLSAGIAGYVARQDAEARWHADTQELEAVPRSRRVGLDANVVIAPVRWLSADASLSLARARTSDGERVLLAPRIFGAAGVTARRYDSYVTLRGRAIGERYVTSSLRTPSQAVLSVAAGTQLRGFELGVVMDNLLDTAWREEQAALTVRATRDADPVTGVSYAPGSPRTVMVTVGHSL